MNTIPTHQPLTLEPLLVERIWGEQAIHEWYSQPVAGKPIGEVWLTAQNCAVEGTSSTLGELTESEPASFGAKAGEGFPLLVKLLYPREKLSVQVHPNDEQAVALLREPRGKTECWYVLSAEPGAQLAIGFKEPVEASAMRRIMEDGTIEAHLRYITVKAGDLVFVPAGTVHAIGPGMVVLETQQYSDATFRLWDYGRPRELHLDAGLTVARSQTPAGLVSPEKMGSFTRLVTCSYFTVDSFRSPGNQTHVLDSGLGMQIIIALGTGVSLQAEGESYALKPGCAVILPSTETVYTLHLPPNVETVRIFQPA